MDKRKRFKLTLEIFRDIFKICPRVKGQDFDALPTDEEIVSFLRELGHTGKINSLNDVVVDQMHQPWRTFTALINKSLFGKTTGLDKLVSPRHKSFECKLPSEECKTMFKLLLGNFIYQIKQQEPIKSKKDVPELTLDFTKVIITLFLTQDKAVKLSNPEMKETKAYKTYIGFATGATPPKKARKFKKLAFPQLSTSQLQQEGVVIRETPEMPLSKKKEKMTVEKRKGIDLLSEVALTEEAQYEEARKKSLSDFPKTHPSVSSIIIKTAPSATKIKPFVTNEGTSVKPGVPNVTEEESFESEAESWGNDEDDSNDDHDSSGKDSDQENNNDDDKTQSDNENESNFEHETDENESGSKSEQEENEEDIGDDEEEITDKAEGDEEMDYTTSQLYDDVDIRLNKPVQADDKTVQKEGTDAELTNNISILMQKFCSLNGFHSILKTKPANTYTPYSTCLSYHRFSPVYSTVIPQSLPSFTPPPQQSTSTPPLTTEATNPQSSLPNFASVFQFNNKVSALEKDEVSNFAPPEIQRMVTKSFEEVVLAKEFSQPQSSYEAAATLTEIEHQVSPNQNLAETSFTNKANQSLALQKSDMPQDQEGNLGNDDDEPMKETVSKRDWFTKPTQPQEPTDPDWNDGKTPQQGPTQSWLMTLASSADKSESKETFYAIDEALPSPIDFSCITS
ncbi:hypothetical protein Tco_0911833 [Tanacetum coccineum]